MDIKIQLTAHDRDSLRTALAASGENDAVYLTCGAVGLSALTLAMPFTASNEGGLRLLCGLILAYFVIRGVRRLITWWLVKRASWFPLPSIAGLEPGGKTLTIALESVREVTADGERVFRWRAFEGATETADWIALHVSDRECLVIPRSALKMRALAESETLVALIERGGR